MELDQHERELIVDACNNETCLSTLTDLSCWRKFKTFTNYTNEQINYIVTSEHNKKEFILQKLKEGNITDNTKKFASILCITLIEMKTKQLRNQGLQKDLWNEIFDKIEEYLPIIHKLDPENKHEPLLIDAMKHLENTRTYRNN